MDFQRLVEIKSLRFPVELHLALSLTEKPAYIEHNINSYMNLGIRSLIFTKLDEGFGYGTLFRVAKKWRIPLSFFSEGAKIPDDLRKATRSYITEKILE